MVRPARLEITGNHRGYHTSVNVLIQLLSHSTTIIYCTLHLPALGFGVTAASYLAIVVRIISNSI